MSRFLLKRMSLVCYQQDTNTPSFQADIIHIQKKLSSAICHQLQHLGWYSFWAPSSVVLHWTDGYLQVMLREQRDQHDVNTQRCVDYNLVIQKESVCDVPHFVSLHGQVSRSLCVLLLEKFVSVVISVHIFAHHIPSVCLHLSVHFD